MKAEKSVLMREVGERIRKARMSAGLQQVQLSKEFQCAASKISNIENGTRDPGVDFYSWFAERTGCSLDYIICGKESQRSLAGADIPQNNDINDALKSLLDSFIDSSSFAKHMAERKLVPSKFDHKLGEILPSEAELLDALREMSVAEAQKVMDYAKSFRK